MCKLSPQLRVRFRLDSSGSSHPEVQRILGVLIFVLALAIAVPLLGFNVAHAAAIFTISLGLVEQDGVAILIGVVAGLASLVLVLAAGVSGKALRSKAFVWARDFTLKLGLNLVVTFAKKFGYKWVKRILSCDLNSSSYRAKNVT
jgi:hypothetical protein